MKTLRLLLLVTFTFCATVLVLVVSAHSAENATPEMRTGVPSSEPVQACSTEDSQACGVERPQLTETSQVTEVDRTEAPVTLAASDQQEIEHSMHSMSTRHMDMGPHMRVTGLRPANLQDRERAEDIVRRLRAAIAKYEDVRVAEGDGFKEFLPNVPQEMKHFTNWRYAV
ncbi:MAG: hypothetical protein JO187_06630, partial [Acidobacteria bacterium]|nr:hypothetical protein [Acidobacteriota bacterium]